MNPLVERLGWTLVHSLWEGALAWLVLKCALIALRRRSAQARYLAGCAALVLATLAPWITFLRLQAALIGRPLLTTVTKLDPDRHLAIAAQAAMISSEVRRGFADLAHDLTAVFPWLVLGWAIGCVWASLRLACDWRATRRLAAAPSRPLPEAIRRRCDVLAARLGIRRAVQFGESLLVQVPSVVGWLKPAIFVPVGAFTGLSPDQIDAVLGHELAHILRHDFPVNLLQSVCDVLFFYHPAILAINRSIRLERENACDDIAVTLTGDPLGYAAALARLEETRHFVLSLAATGNGDLLGRIRRLLGRPPARERPVSAAASLALAGACLYFSAVLIGPKIVAQLSAGDQAARAVHVVPALDETKGPKAVEIPSMAAKTISQNTLADKDLPKKQPEATRAGGEKTAPFGQMVAASVAAPIKSPGPQAKAVAVKKNAAVIASAEINSGRKETSHPAIPDTTAESTIHTSSARPMMPIKPAVNLVRDETPPIVTKSQIVISAQEADQIPAPVSGVGPLYPVDMMRRGIGGEVMVDFIVDTNGTVRNAYALSSTRQEFETCAVQAVSHWTFSPGKSHGHLVVAHLRIPIRFTYKDGFDEQRREGIQPALLVIRL